MTTFVKMFMHVILGFILIDKKSLTFFLNKNILKMHRDKSSQFQPKCRGFFLFHYFQIYAKSYK